MSPVAEALETARRAKGLTQEALASAADVTQVSISRYERESRVPEDDVLDRLASALGVTPVFLRAAGKPRGAWAIDAHLRRRATAKPGIWRRLEAQLNMLRQHARYLYEEIDVLSEQSVPTFDHVSTEPEAAARMTRMQWRMPVGPVEQLMDWLEAAGCLVVERDFRTERVGGLSQWVDGYPILYLNATVPTDRKRFTAAHELGHLSLHTTDISEDVEGEANRFAAEFLMPASMIRSELRNVTLGQLFDLKRVWGVSVQALIERAVDLRLLTPQRRITWYKQLSARGWRKQEPGSDELRPEHPKIAQRIGMTLTKRGFSSADIASLAGYATDATDNPFIPRPRRLTAI